MDDLMSQFKKVCADYPQFQALVGEVLSSGELEPEVREFLGSASRSMDQMFAELQQTVPQEIAKLDQNIAATRASLEQTEEELEDVDQKLAGMMAAAAAARAAPVSLQPPPAEPPLDPRYGKQLAAELLDRFSGTPRQAVGFDAGAVTEMTSGEFRAEDAPPVNVPLAPLAPAAAAPAEPSKRKPKKTEQKREPRTKPGGDAWEMSSGAWKVDDE